MIDGDPFPEGIYRPLYDPAGRCKPDMNYPRFSEDDYDVGGGGGPGGSSDSGKANIDTNVAEGVITSLNPISWQRPAAFGNEPGEQNQSNDVGERRGSVGSKAIKGPRLATCQWVWEPREPEARVKRRRRIPSHGAGPLEQEVFSYPAGNDSLRRLLSTFAKSAPAALHSPQGCAGKNANERRLRYM